MRGSELYLEEILIHNSGPIGTFDLTMPFDQKTKNPVSVVLLGANGSGKTTLTSIVGDSFFEAAANYFTDVVPRSNAHGERPFFRVVGSVIRTFGSPFSVCILRYVHQEAALLYGEKSGVVPADFISALQDNLLPVLANLQSVNAKAFAIPEATVTEIFATTSLLYFPSNRAEAPHWLNGSAVDQLEFDTTRSFDKQLRRPIYIERGLKRLEQWMLSLVLDTQVDFEDRHLADGSVISVAVGPLDSKRVDQSIWEQLNQILRTIMNDEGARFVYGHRRSALKLGFVMSDGRALPLDAMSGGQVALLNLFGGLMMYGDRTSTGAHPDRVEAVCVVDEIGAHMHVELQSKALPQLVHMFPRVQFVVSAHSPIFVLGLQQEFSSQTLPLLVEMPNGRPIQAEAYSEFAHALDVLRATQRFNDLVVEHVSGKSAKLLVFCEGETDPKYINAAIQALDRGNLFTQLDVDWIGSKDEKGQALNGGKDGLNAALKLLRAKPDLAKRPVLFLYDNDTNKPLEDNAASFYVRVIPDNPSNGHIKAGIENLLPGHVFRDQMFETTTKTSPSGTTTTVRSLQKVRLCEEICRNPDPADFANFGAVLDILEHVHCIAAAARVGEPVESSGG